MPSIDLRAEYNGDLTTLAKLYNRIHNAAEFFRSQKRAGRVKNDALRRTIAILTSLFEVYNRKKNPVSKRRRHDFIAAALDAAGSSHPKPGSIKFYNLPYNQPKRTIPPS